MTRVPNDKAIRSIGKQVLYRVWRNGRRVTVYYYTTLDEAIKKYDELCIKGNYYSINLHKLPVNGKVWMESIYTTSTNTVNVPHRDIAKKR